MKIDRHNTLNMRKKKNDWRRNLKGIIFEPRYVPYQAYRLDLLIRQIKTADKPNDRMSVFCCFDFLKTSISKSQIGRHFLIFNSPEMTSLCKFSTVTYVLKDSTSKIAKVLNSKFRAIVTLMVTVLVSIVTFMNLRRKKNIIFFIYILWKKTVDCHIIWVRIIF